MLVNRSRAARKGCIATSMRALGEAMSACSKATFHGSRGHTFVPSTPKLACGLTGNIVRPKSTESPFQHQLVASAGQLLSNTHVTRACAQILLNHGGAERPWAASLRITGTSIMCLIDVNCWPGRSTNMPLGWPTVAGAIVRADGSEAIREHLGVRGNHHKKCLLDANLLCLSL